MAPSGRLAAGAFAACTAAVLYAVLRTPVHHRAGPALWVCAVLVGWSFVASLAYPRLLRAAPRDVAAVRFALGAAAVPIGVAGRFLTGSAALAVGGALAGVVATSVAAAGARPRV